MRPLLVTLLLLALGCGAAPASTPPTDVAFRADVVASPAPPPKRQIDRGDAAKEEVDVHTVDKTLAAGTTASGTTTPAPTGGAPPPPPPPVARIVQPQEGSLLVYSAHVTMAVYRVEPALDAVEKAARTLGGYLASRSDTQIQVRVPRASFDEALRLVEASGDVVHRDITAEDVTDAYVDAEARLKNARAVRDRLEELLAKASVKEAIEIQRELERVTGEIEVLEGKLKLLSNRVAYSTIDVLFQPRGSAALHDAPVRLPFPWLRELGLPRLLDLGGGV